MDQQLLATHIHFKSPKPLYLPAGKRREKTGTTGLDIFGFTIIFTSPYPSAKLRRHLRALEILPATERA